MCRTHVGVCSGRNILGTGKGKSARQTDHNKQTLRRPANIYDILLNYVTYHTFMAMPRMCMPRLLIFLFVAAREGERESRHDPGAGQ